MLDYPGPASAGSPSRASLRMVRIARRTRRNSWDRIRLYALLATTLCLALAFATAPPHARAQAQTAGPRITAIDPGSAKVNDSVSITGQNLGKPAVTAIYLSNDKDDFKATLADQSDDKIVFKVPQVKTGSYNVSLMIGGTILIQPVRLSVE